jgi:hypothetical protein
MKLAAAGLWILASGTLWALNANADIYSAFLIKVDGSSFRLMIVPVTEYLRIPMVGLKPLVTPFECLAYVALLWR